MMRSLKRTFILSFLVMMVTMMTHAQDLHFSQFYAAPLYLSPSLAGSTDGGRLIANYRNQWPGIGNAFQTYSVSYDNYFSRMNSGIGFLMSQDIAGTTNLTSRSFAFQYSYNLMLNENWQIVPGLQFSYANKSVDFSKISFGNEIIGNGSSGSWTRLSYEKTNYIDFAASVFLYSEKYWFGVTLDHLSQPNYSFLNEDMELPLKMVMFGGMNIWTERNRHKSSLRSFSFSYRFQMQEQNKQLDVGAYWFNNPIEVGLWYRGLPFLNNSVSILSQDAIVALLSYKYGAFRVGYSYDISISQLGRNSQGAHELSLMIEFNQGINLRRKGRRPALPCSDAANPLLKKDGGKYKKQGRRVI